MTRMTTQLRAMLKRGQFLELPATYDPITARLAESAGFKSVYNGGFVTGGKTCLSEPLLTMSDQIGTAAEIAKSVKVPLVMDAGAGWGEPLHTMRTVRECIWAGIAGVHIEDQFFPKRAHYHSYVVHTIPRDEFVDKIKYACRARDEVDRDFVIIARSDAAREEGIKEAIDRVNAAANVGADMGLVFPRTHDEAVLTPKRAKLPMVYVQSRGTRDGRPLYSFKQLKAMGYAGSIDATLAICVVYHRMREAMMELKKTGDYTGMTEQEFVAARKGVEDIIGLEEFYEIEEQTVEKGQGAAKPKRKAARRAA
jgi:2-methylisocitrate lyase-like PEP mutase family enzyme